MIYKQDLTMILLIGICFLSNCSSSIIGNNVCKQRMNIMDKKISLNMNKWKYLSIRGGDEFDEYDEYDDEESNEITKSDSSIVSFTKKSLYYIIKLSFRTLYAFQRAFKAGFITALNDESSSSKKMLNIMEAMWKAAIHEEGKETNEEKVNKSKEDIASLYGVKSSETLILDGTLSEALRECRSKARLLIVFLPSSKGKKSSNDKTCMESLVSEEVNKVLEAKKGSYFIWSAEYGSIEANQAIKMLKPTKVSKKTPILLVAYPTIKTRLKVLAQHHCNPPPTNESLASFLKALRKRHANQIKSMRHWLREAEYQNERQMNYKQSMELDTQRKHQERLEKEQKEKQIQEEKEKEILLDQRRSSFLESLQEEPNGDHVITVAFRLADGRNGQRKFHSNDSMDIIFNYVDANFLWDRELLSVTTMRGDNKVSWDESQQMTIADYAGSTKMLGLRISLQKES